MDSYYRYPTSSCAVDSIDKITADRTKTAYSLTTKSAFNSSIRCLLFIYVISFPLVAFPQLEVQPSFTSLPFLWSKSSLLTTVQSISRHPHAYNSYELPKVFFGGPFYCASKIGWISPFFCRLYIHLCGFLDCLYIGEIWLTLECVLSARILFLSMERRPVFLYFYI
ncbi:hypothetical protein ACJIZ3_000057 [Penstemon smallii]|uniref:Uncharacterized protein n=1 Tax=Penstemon smallii TaxID=265156 RepID=A0ABD3RCN0_9LAMI